MDLHLRLGVSRPTGGELTLKILKGLERSIEFICNRMKELVLLRGTGEDNDVNEWRLAGILVNNRIQTGGVLRQDLLILGTK